MNFQRRRTSPQDKMKTNGLLYPQRIVLELNNAIGIDSALLQPY